MRTCPSCNASVSAGEITAYSDTLVCLNCGKPLGVSAISRNLSIALGLVAGWLVWHFTIRADTNEILGWVLPIVYSYLTFSFVSTLALMASADLLIREAAPTASGTATDSAHGSAHGPAAMHH